MIVHRPLQKLLVLVAFTLACVGIFLALLDRSGEHLLGTARRSVWVTLPNAFQLVPKGQISENGIPVGEVADVQYALTPGGVQSRVRLAIDRPYKVYRDAHVALRTKTLVGENYIDLEPGTPAAGPLANGDRLGIQQAQTSVQLDQVLSTFDPRTRARVKQDLDALGAGLDGHGADLNRMLAGAGAAGDRGRAVLGLLDRQREQVAHAVRNTERVLDAFGHRTRAVRTLAQQARLAADAAASRDKLLGEAIDSFPPTLARARATIGRLAGFSTRSTPVIDDLTDVTHRITPLLRDLGPTARASKQLFNRLPGALEHLRPLLGELPPLSDRLRPAVYSLDAFLRQANPLLRYISPFAREAAAFFPNAGDALGSVDAAGNKARVFPIVSASSYAGLPDATKQALHTLVSLGSAGVSAGEDTNPYPKPGTVGSPQPSNGNYPRLTADLPTAEGR
jgi:phospholipid/cholesterol/gamma-HCH transport system substrate-binding protein